jgi:hypothetical protein
MEQVWQEEHSYGNSKVIQTKKDDSSTQGCLWNGQSLGHGKHIGTSK